MTKTNITIIRLLPAIAWLMCGASLFVTFAPGIKLVGATLFFLFFPGWFLQQAILPDAEDSILEKLPLAVGLSLGIPVLGALLSLYFFKAVTLPGIYLLPALVSLASMFITARRTRRIPALPANRADVFMVAGVCLLAGFYSLANLGFSDFMGDEMNGLLRAIAVIRGREFTLFEHTKGPVEVLVPAIFGLCAGGFSPLIVRFPFAVSHIAGVAIFAMLGRRMFNRWVGGLGALLLALNGLYLGFGRIVQYQAVVFLMTALSVWAGYRFYQSRRTRYLYLSSFFCAVGLLAHYDIIFAFPPIAYLCWLALRRTEGGMKRFGPHLAASLALFLGLSALFFIPFILHPHAGKTESYLAGIIGAEGWPYNNLKDFYVFTVMYNCRYFAAFITLLLAGKLAGDIIASLRYPQRTLKIICSALLLAALAAGLLQPVFGLILLFCAVFLFLWQSAGFDAEHRTLYLWLAVPAIGYLFFVDRPRTHFQVVYPAWSFLLAIALTQAAAWLRQKRTQPLYWSLAGGSAIILLVSGIYQYILFIDNSLEYVLTYPAHKIAAFWEDPGFPFGSRRMYGTIHRLGWQMITNQFLTGELSGDWGSNDQGTNLTWYTIGQPRNDCYPSYFLLSEFQQREAKIRKDLLKKYYTPLAEVRNNDASYITVYQFDPLGEKPAEMTWEEPSVYPALLTAEAFKSTPYDKPEPAIASPLAPVAFRPSSEALKAMAQAYDPRLEQVQDSLALLGYTTTMRWARPGGVLLVDLYWRVIQPLHLNYKVFIHLLDREGNIVTQADDFPNCGLQSTDRWEAGETMPDRHLLRLPKELPSGRYQLLVGIYEPKTGVRFDLPEAGGNALNLTTIDLPAAP